MEKKRGCTTRHGRRVVCPVPGSGAVSGDTGGCWESSERRGPSPGHLSLSGQHVLREPLKWLRRDQPLVKTA